MRAGRLLHVLGGGPWQVPTVLLARRLGYRVLVTDLYRERPAYPSANVHEAVDVTDLDATLFAATRHSIDGVIADTSDTAVRTAAYVAARLGLPGIGYETSLNFTNKARMREIAVRAGLDGPSFAVVRTEAEGVRAAEALGLPVVVKPVDSQSSRGVTRVERRELIGAAFTYAMSCSRDKQVLVEEWVPGVEVIVDSFAIGGRVVPLGIAGKTPHPDTPAVGLRITYPASLPEPMLARIEQANARLVTAMGLRDGIVHAEYIIGDDRIMPLDLAARGGGVGIYTHVLPHLTGVDVNAQMIRFAMGEPLRVARMFAGRAANIEFFRAPPGTALAVEGVEEARRSAGGVAALHIGVGPGDTVRPVVAKDDRAGHIVTLGETTEEVVRSGQQAKSLIRMRMADKPSSVPVE